MATGTGTEARQQERRQPFSKVTSKRALEAAFGVTLRIEVGVTKWDRPTISLRRLLFAGLDDKQIQAVERVFSSYFSEGCVTWRKLRLPAGTPPSLFSLFFCDTARLQKSLCHRVFSTTGQESCLSMNCST